MSIDGSDAHPIYRPVPEDTLDAEAHDALRRDPRDWTGVGHLPDGWIIALAGPNPHATYGIDIDGVWVTFTVAAATDDPAAMCAALRQLRHVVAETPATRPEVPVIERRLPRQIGSARWHSPSGDVTVIQPGQARHRRPPRRRFAAFGAPVAAVSALLHGLRSSAAPLGAAAGIAAVAMVPALPSPPATPARPVPGHTREGFVPPADTPAAAPDSKGRPSQTRGRTRLTAPAPSAPAPSTTPDPADSLPAVVSVLPTITITVPVVGSPSPTKPASTPSTQKTQIPPLRKVVKRVAKRACVTVQVPLLHKKVTTCKQS